MKAILETEDLVKYYGEGENQVRAIDHTSMQVQHGEFVAVVGRSGSWEEYASSYARRSGPPGQWESLH